MNDKVLDQISNELKSMRQEQHTMIEKLDIHLNSLDSNMTRLHEDITSINISLKRFNSEQKVKQ